MAVVQARLGSTRFPGKVLEPLADTNVIGYMLRRLKQARNLDQIVFAVAEGDVALVNALTALNANISEGSPDDVLDRVYNVAAKVGANTIVRLTGDCPLIDPQLIDLMVSRHASENLDYLGYGMKPNYPDGLGTEVVRFTALKTAWEQGQEKADREHVTWFIRNRPEDFRIGVQRCAENCGHIRFTVDYPDDLVVIRNIVKVLDQSDDASFRFEDVVELYNLEPRLFEANSWVKRRNEAGPFPQDYTELI